MESGIHSVESGIQDSLGLPYVGQHETLDGGRLVPKLFAFIIIVAFLPKHRPDFPRPGILIVVFEVCQHTPREEGIITYHII